MTMKEEIEQCLNSILEDVKDGVVKEAMYYSLLAPGKRLRPMMMLKVIQSYGVNYRPFIDIACAIEMVHTYSLIHDDLPAMDDDDLRRGRKTCHKQFDEATAILAGDALLTQAFVVISHSQIPDQQKIECLKILSSASGQEGMIYGQQQDILFENKKASLEDLMDIHLHKTGKLIIAPLVMGSILANHENDCEIFEEIGEKIGIAFQIQDDVLDIIGDEKLIGKKIGSDLSSHKSTYVSLLGIEKSQTLVKQYFNEALQLVYNLKVNHGILIELLQTILKRVN